MPVGKAKRLPATPATEATEVPEATATVAFAERTPAGRRAPVVIAVAAAMFVGAGAFAGATLQPYLAERAQVDTKLDIARTAAEAITTLWTYTPENMESLGDRASRYLGGDFADQYRRYVDAIAPTNKQAQVTNSTQVVGAAVESLDGPDATALVYTNTTSTSPLSKNIPAMRYLSYRLTLRRENATWLVTKMSTVTSLDLTPQL
jgi:Mce-associated membrane protein